MAQTSDLKVLQKEKLYIAEQTIVEVGSNCKEKYFKFVGHVIDDQLTWEGHIKSALEMWLTCLIHLTLSQYLRIWES